ncbi:replication factor C subunit 3-like isoform X2 [Punica granatum]|uniref:Replication factor C subunit 3-like isoform X2 n=2 Tax=Punica granatum TaxID=22663 RepID=A0A6P8EFD0_PUNGR|nr:replication factor C subunit 3-like isoform X2 [Punica granatum]
MPTPPLILRSASEPDICVRSGTIPNPNCSYWSAPAPKTLWRRMSKKLASIRKIRKEHSNCSDLTEENLQEHNIRQEIIHRSSKCSPYYKGLLALDMDSSVDIGTSSPGQESHSTTVHTSSTSVSSFIVKMRSFGSSKTRGVPGSSTPTSAQLETTLLTREISADKRTLKDSSGRILKAKEKPLRERVSEADQEPGAVQNIRKPSNPRAATKSRRATSRDEQHHSSSKVTIRVDDRDSSDRSMTGTEFVWASKYRPKALKDFICNRDIALSLQGQIKDGNCGHFIFEGQPGVGKRTMIWAMLREVFGPDKIQAREERKVFDLGGDSRGSIEVSVRESTQHVEVSVSKLKGYEKHIIVELIKETQSKSSNKAPDDCRAMILYEADRLSTDALLYIRWLLEKHKNTKVFFCCSDVSKLQPIKPLCSVLKLLPPSRDEIIQVLEFIAKQEGIHLPYRLAEKIADSSKNNLRQAIRSFEATWQKTNRLMEDQVILTGWEDDIAMIAKKITQEQSSKQLYKIRGKLQLLSEHNVSPEFIFEFLVQELKKHLDEQLQDRVDCLFKEYKGDDGRQFESNKPNWPRNPKEEASKRCNSSMKRNFQDFMGVEEFIARFMSCYKHSVSNKNENSTTLQSMGYSQTLDQSCCWGEDQKKS